MSRDVIADFVTSIRNAFFVKKKSLVVPFSKFKANISQVLKNEGFILDFQPVDLDAGKKGLKVFLKYQNGVSVISEIKKVSKQGRRIYSSFDNLLPVKSGLGILILSTNKGVMSDLEVKKMASSDKSAYKLGGELICSVW